MHLVHRAMKMACGANFVLVSLMARQARCGLIGQGSAVSISEPLIESWLATLGLKMPASALQNVPLEPLEAAFCALK